MARYKVTKDLADSVYFRGRILWREDGALFGYTNSSFTVHFRGKKVSALLKTGDNAEVNEPGLRVYVDDAEVKEIVLHEREENVTLAEFDEEAEHSLRVVKITEAAMSYVCFAELEVEGELLPKEEDKRPKALFIGDSITCGYGVLGAPDSEYTVREEDGERCYAAFLAKEMDWNAEWVSVSGHGMFVEYTGDTENILPREFPYTNWFYDKETREDYSRFQPDYIVVNLGTNDSGNLSNPWILGGFKSRYESFLYTLRLAYPEAKIICVLGTLAPGVYPYVAEVIERVKAAGMKEVYGLELPEHDVEHDGMASGHPTEATHRKDAERIAKFVRSLQ